MKSIAPTLTHTKSNRHHHQHHKYASSKLQTAVVLFDSRCIVLLSNLLMKNVAEYDFLLTKKRYRLAEDVYNMNNCDLEGYAYAITRLRSWSSFDVIGRLLHNAPYLKLNPQGIAIINLRLLIEILNSGCAGLLEGLKVVFATEFGRVRVVVRLHHKNADFLISDDYFNCVELQHENMERHGRPVGERCTKDDR
ncbi:hypothetical protein Tco_1000896 [Tanacetum coccineum]